MAYVATRGGEKAIQNAEKLHRLLNAPLSAELVKTIETAMPYLLDRVIGESSLYAPELAALALAQTGGDLYEAVLLLRAYRSTQPRLAYAEVVEQEDLLTVRRISAAFKDIPGGQLLGPTLDYSHRVLKLEALSGEAETERLEPASTPTPTQQPAVADWQRSQGLLAGLQADETVAAELPDLTREPLLFPAPRAHRLQALARGDTGGVLSLGYANMRGYGSVHPTINELRLAYAEVGLTHPVTGARFSAGRVRVSQAEIVTKFAGGSERPELSLGFAATLGWNEVKTIAASMLDMAMDKAEPHPAHSEEFVLYHTEPVESSGFCIHYKLPHYVTFQSSLEAMRRVRDDAPAAEKANSEKAKEQEKEKEEVTT